MKRREGEGKIYKLQRVPQVFQIRRVKGEFRKIVKVNPLTCQSGHELWDIRHPQIKRWTNKMGKMDKQNGTQGGTLANAYSFVTYTRLCIHACITHKVQYCTQIRKETKSEK